MVHCCLWKIACCLISTARGPFTPSFQHNLHETHDLNINFGQLHILLGTFCTNQTIRSKKLNKDMWGRILELQVTRITDSTWTASNSSKSIETHLHLRDLEIGLDLFIPKKLTRPWTRLPNETSINPKNLKIVLLPQKSHLNLLRKWWNPQNSLHNFLTWKTLGCK